MRKTSMFLVGFLVLSAGSTGAETITLESMVVTGSKEKQDEQVIEKEVLRTHKVMDLAEILSDEMVDATLIRKSAYGNEVAIRGFGKSNLRVFLDDSILEGACGSRKDPGLSLVNLLAVDRLDVRMGPCDVRHPGALGGSINVLTRNPRDGFRAETLLKGGSYGFFSGGLLSSGGNEDVQGLLGYNYAQSGQYRDGCGRKLSSFATAPGYNALGLNMNAFDKHDAWGKLLVHPGERQSLLFSFHFGLAQDVLTPRVEFDTENEQTYLGSVRYTIKDLCSFSDRLDVEFYRNQVNHNPTQIFREMALDKMKRNHVVSTFTGGRVENLQETSFADLTYGFDIYQQNWDGEMYLVETGAVFDAELIPDVDSLDAGLFVDATKSFDRWSLTLGLRGDYYTTEAHKPLPNTVSKLGITANGQTRYLPSGYVSAIWFLTDAVSLYGALGHSVRPPTGVELYLQPPRGAAFAGNPTLKPTRNTEVDLGVEVHHGRLALFTNFFYSYLEDFIYQQAPPKTWVNIDAEMFGASGRLDVDLWYNFSVSGAVAYVRGIKKTFPTWNGAVTNTDLNLAEIPPLKTRLALGYNTRKLFGTFEWIHSEPANQVDIEAGEVKLAGWDVLNARIGYEPWDFLVLVFGVDNSLDACYAVANSYEFDVVSGSGAHPPIVYEPGRFFFGTFTLRYDSLWGKS